MLNAGARSFGWAGRVGVRSVGAMETFILWCGLLGAWLLVAGPIYQAALELRDEEFEHDRLAQVKSSVPRPDPIPGWWWLLPPVMYVLHRRVRRRYRDAVFAELTAQDVEDFVSFSEKATAWLIVGTGGLLIALKETWELCEHEEWSQAVFWPLGAVALGLCTANTALRMQRSRDLRAARGAVPAA